MTMIIEDEEGNPSSHEELLNHILDYSVPHQKGVTGDIYIIKTDEKIFVIRARFLSRDEDGIPSYHILRCEIQDK